MKISNFNRSFYNITEDDACYHYLVIRISSNILDGLIKNRYFDKVYISGAVYNKINLVLMFYKIFIPK